MMKHIYKLSFLLAVVVLFASCSKDDNTYDPATPNMNVLRGDIISDMHLTEGEYVIIGYTVVKNGVSLVIDAGVRVIGVDKSLAWDAPASLIIEPGAKLIVNGTKEKPVVFTSDSLMPGSWGGILIQGKAIVNTNANNTPNTALVGWKKFPYGGDDINDNSGSIHYLKIEYASDLNQSALQLNGVGAGTIIENVEIFESSAAGVVINGGAVNVKNLVVNGVNSNGVLWDKGWQGKGQFWAINKITENTVQRNESPLIYGFSKPEAGNSPVISNVTLIGDNASVYAAHFGNNAKVEIYNVLLKDFPNEGAVRSWDNGSCTNINDKALIMDYMAANNVKKYFYYDAVVEEANKFENSSNSTFDATFSIDEYFVAIADGGIDISTNDSWFESINYKGAVSETSEWTKGWITK